MEVDSTPSGDNSFCWLWQSGTDLKMSTAVPMVSMVSGPVPDRRLRSAGSTNYLMRALQSIPELSREALVYQIPLWRVESLPPFSVEDIPRLCSPDPLVDIRFSSQRIVRGRTMVLYLKTRIPVECEVTYLKRTVPCYRLDENNFYALLGVSALTSPGNYPLHLSLSSKGRTVAFDVNVDVDAGQYGYQFIDPPTALSSLLNQELMENEWESLRPWRELRTKDRMWDYPLQSPLENTPSISADYGDRRSYGGMFEGYHSGIDYRASRGTPVVAPTAGRVVFVDRLEARGNAVLVDHGWGLVTGYWHLSAINVGVGDQVAGGEILGWVGNTGLSTGSHLHWELWVNGVAVDGRQWLAGEGLLVSLPQPMDFSFQDGFVGSPIPEPY